MAQRTEKEETEFKAVPETLTLCVNNCGVTGNPATKNMCHNCFTATTSSAAIVTPSHKFPTAADGVRNPRSTSRSEEIRRSPTARNRPVLGVGSAAATRVVNRCSGCQRKVGLTGFRCRCGDLFCADHRYSDRHECSYDYKAAGREAIARENPVVKAAKIFRV